VATLSTISVRVRRVIAVGSALVLAAVVVSAGSANGVGAVRGFDGSTITVAGIGIKAQFPGAPVGAKARIKRFNDTNEIPGIKINYADFADDNQDPATSLTEARRLVTQVGAFAIVGDESVTNPGQYLAQQHVPYFGWAFDKTYCSPAPSTKLWGFGFYGCVTPEHPSFVNGYGSDLYAYTTKLTGKKHPTIAGISNDNATGARTVKIYQRVYQVRGFKSVYAKGAVPPDASDYTPYVQELLKSNGGSAPDVISCLMGVQCLNLYQLLQASGFKGTYWSPLYSDILVKPLAGSVVGPNEHSISESNPGLDQLKKDINAVSPGYAVDTGALGSYASTDMFIQVLKKLAKKGKSNITPENVQKVASTITWELPGVAGPTKYPDSTVMGTPYCTTLLKSNGTKWETVVPYKCYPAKTPVKI
jgi:branched-chain amino acid transport system substrate-binding protein